MKYRYRINMEFDIIYESEDVGELYSSEEVAHNIAEFVSDELIFANGITSYNILNHSREEIKE